MRRAVDAADQPGQLLLADAADEPGGADQEWFGQVFESLVIRDLRVYSQGLEAEVFHYRDDYGLEVDAIVQLRNGRWGAPAFLAVICSKGYGYRRSDGVVVVPIGAPGP